MSPFKTSLIVSISTIFFYALLCTLFRVGEIFATFPAITFPSQPNSTINIPFEEISLSVDTNTLHGIFVPADSEKYVYYFHGNGGPLPVFYSEIAYIHSLGYNVFSYDYPGYGLSNGWPNDTNISDFSDAFYKYIQKEKNISVNNLTLRWYSIGSAVATQFAHAHPGIYSNLILISPLSSRYWVATEKIGFPIQTFFFRKNSFDTASRVRDISTPTLVIHGDQDTLLPISHGKEIFKNSASREKAFITLTGASHNFDRNTYGEPLAKNITNFIEGKPIKRTQKLGIPKKKPPKKIPMFDTDSDDSVQKFVWPHDSLSEIAYIPQELVPIVWEFVTQKGKQLLRPEAKTALDAMAKDFHRTFGVPLHVVSAYRSYTYQEGIKERGCEDHFCAHAGHSEHQTGLAVDFFEATDETQFLAKKENREYFDWLNEHAHTYGFHNSYQNGPDIEWYATEPWHRRYLWIELATLLHDENTTFTLWIKSELEKIRKISSISLCVQKEDLYKICNQKQDFTERKKSNADSLSCTTTIFFVQKNSDIVPEACLNCWKSKNVFLSLHQKWACSISEVPREVSCRHSIK